MVKYRRFKSKNVLFFRKFYLILREKWDYANVENYINGLISMRRILSDPRIIKTDFETNLQ